MLRTAANPAHTLVGSAGLELSADTSCPCTHRCRSGTHHTPGIFLSCFMCSSYSTAQMVPVTRLPLSCSASGLDSMMRKPPRLTHSLRLNLAGIMHSVVAPSGYCTYSRNPKTQQTQAHIMTHVSVDTPMVCEAAGC